jgi:quercetin dioxygenase-like cupin family protein
MNMRATTGAETINVGAVRIRFLVEPEHADGSVSVFECLVPAAAKVPLPHSHDAFEETIYGLHGSSTWTIDGETIEIGPGEAVCIPRGVVHGFVNHGDEDARFLCIASPGVFGPTYFREAGAVIAAADGPPDPAAIAEVMRRHGLTPVVPA